MCVCAPKKETNRLLSEAGEMELLDRLSRTTRIRLRPNILSLKCVTLASAEGTKEEVGTLPWFSPGRWVQRTRLGPVMCSAWPQSSVVPGDSPPSAPASTFTTLRHRLWARLWCYCLPAPTSKKDNNLEGISPRETAFEALTFLSHCSVSPRYLW